MDELVAQFRMERVHKGGAKFDFEKAKWFNQEWIKHSSTERLLPDVLPILQHAGIAADVKKLSEIIPLVKERCVLLNDFVQQCGYFFKEDKIFILELKKSNDNNLLHNLNDNKINIFFKEILNDLDKLDFSEFEIQFKNKAKKNDVNLKDVLPLFRIALVGGKFGPNVFEIAKLLGKKKTKTRLNHVLYPDNINT
jgi:glutamyl-tRNA synthetase